MFTREVADQVLQSLAEGKSLRKAAAEAGIAASTVLDWCEENKEFGEQYTRTRARAYEMLADEILEISDEAQVEVKSDGEDVTLDLSATAVARNRLRVDSRKWMLSKMLPKRYGDKIDVSGSLDLNQKIERITRKVVDPTKPDGTADRDAPGIPPAA